MSIDRIKVELALANEPWEVGELVLDRRKIYFKYYPAFLRTGINISPLHLVYDNRIQTPSVPFFDGLFGVFADSLPDGWGRLLLDRALSSRGIDISSISPLDRLAYVGENGMGALTYHPVLEHPAASPLPLIEDLDEIAEQMRRVWSGRSEEVIERLLVMGGSSGGARPKVLIGYDPVNDRIVPDDGALPAGYEPWLIKFPASVDRPDIGVVEYAYHRMARTAGIEMADCRLFRGASGVGYFGTQRFDRQGNKRLHLHSAAGLMHDNFRLSNMDYGHLMDAAFRLEKDVAAHRKVLRLAAFNVYAHNRDDHSKNFSFLMNHAGRWSLAPAYDLTFSQSAHGHHQTMVAGEGRNPGREQLLRLADTFGIAQSGNIIEEVREAVSQWPVLARDCGVPTATIREIDAVLRIGLKR